MSVSIEMSVNSMWIRAGSLIADLLILASMPKKKEAQNEK